MSKLKNHFTLFVVLALVVMVAAGCSSGLKRSDKAVSSVDKLSRDCTALQTHIDRTIRSMDSMATVQQTYLREAYGRYSAELKAMNKQAKKVAKGAEKLRNKSRAYLDAWEAKMQDVKDPDLRKQAAKRRDVAAERFAKTRDEFTRIRDNYNKFAESLSEIQVALDNDLNPAGVKSVAKFIKRAKKDAEPLKEDIQTIVEALQEVAEVLSGVNPAEG